MEFESGMHASDDEIISLLQNSKQESDIEILRLRSEIELLSH